MKYAYGDMNTTHGGFYVEGGSGRSRNYTRRKGNLNISNIKFNLILQGSIQISTNT